MSVTCLDEQQSAWLQLRLVTIDCDRTTSFDNIEPMVCPLMLDIWATFLASRGENHDGRLRSGIGDREPEARTKRELIALHSFTPNVNVRDDQTKKRWCRSHPTSIGAE